MSNQTKETVIEIKKSFEKISKDVDGVGQKSGTIADKELSIKIQKVKEGASEVIKHIEKRMNNS